MPVTKLDHYLVVSETLELTRDFYTEVLGLEVGSRPDLGFAGYWLYLGGVACLHLADRESYAAYKARVGTPVPRQTMDTGSIDHIAFNAADFPGTIERLESHGLEYRSNEIPDIGLTHIFVPAPKAVTFELTFRESEG